MRDRAWLWLGIIITVASLVWASFCAHLADVAYQRHDVVGSWVYGVEGMVCVVCFVVNAHAVWSQR